MTDDIRQQVTNQLAEQDFVKKVDDYCQKIKSEKSFKFPFKDTHLVRILQEAITSTEDEAYAEGFIDGRMVRNARKRYKHD